MIIFRVYLWQPNNHFIRLILIVGDAHFGSRGLLTCRDTYGEIAQERASPVSSILAGLGLLTLVSPMSMPSLSNSP